MSLVTLLSSSHAQHGQREEERSGRSAAVSSASLQKQGCGALTPAQRPALWGQVSGKAKLQQLDVATPQSGSG